MTYETQNTNIAQEKDLTELNDELHLLEVETFEIEDLSDLGQNPATIYSSCSSTCTSTGSTSC
ncbi:MAG TPA: thiazolylpeptide-type bacteriocin [Ktedonobacteraceae bacterium]|nr:thiazolylpeptide-type bacteriocin [Ktedonobacteraceae bacterium]